MKASKALCCSRNPICGVSVGQENRLDVTNPHTERFFLNLKNRPAVGVWYRLKASKHQRSLQGFGLVFQQNRNHERHKLSSWSLKNVHLKSVDFFCRNFVNKELAII